MKKYAKLWKFMYYKYANLAECRKCLDDHGFDKKKWLNKDELKVLVKNVNFKMFDTFDVESLNFEAFKEWIM